jgi:hypothetical protein
LCNFEGFSISEDKLYRGFGLAVLGFFDIENMSSRIKIVVNMTSKIIYSVERLPLYNRSLFFKTRKIASDIKIKKYNNFKTKYISVFLRFIFFRLIKL